MTMELEARLRTQQRVTVFALLLAGGSLGFAIWSRRNPPDKLRFEDEGVETIIDGYGITTRTITGNVSAKLDHMGLTLAASKFAADIPGAQATVQAIHGFQHSRGDDHVRIGNGSIMVQREQSALELSVALTPTVTMRGTSGALTLEPTHLAMSAGKLRADLLLNPDAKSVGLDLEASTDSRVSAVARSETSWLSVKRDLRHGAMLSAGVADEDPTLRVKAELNERTYGAK